MTANPISAMSALFGEEDTPQLLSGTEHQQGRLQTIHNHTNMLDILSVMCLHSMLDILHMFLLNTKAGR